MLVDQQATVISTLLDMGGHIEREIPSAFGGKIVYIRNGSTLTRVSKLTTLSSALSEAQYAQRRKDKGK
jgi:hypothetical protein